MKKFQRKSEFAQQILNLKEQIVLSDSTIHTSGKYIDSSGVESPINEDEYYYDNDYNMYPRKFIDMYYTEIK